MSETGKNDGSSVDVVKKILSKHIYKINDDLKKVTEQAEKIINSVLEETEVMDGLTDKEQIIEVESLPAA